MTYNRKLMKSMMASLCVLLALSEAKIAEGAQATVSASIQSREISPHRISLEFCEFGYCTTIGRPEGYSKESFSTMKRACDSFANKVPLVSNVLKTLAFGAVTLGTGGWAQVAAGTLAVGGITLDSSDPEAIKSSSQMLPGLTNQRGVFNLSLEDFNQLYSGLLQCHKLYDETPLIWLQDCKDLACKKKIAEGLNWSDFLINKTSAISIFLLRSELKRPYLGMSTVPLSSDRPGEGKR